MILIAFPLKMWKSILQNWEMDGQPVFESKLSTSCQRAEIHQIWALCMGYLTFNNLYTLKLLFINLK